MTFVPASNTFTGAPTQDGVFTVTFTITDSSTGAGPYTMTATATLTVGLPPAPVATSFTGVAVGYNDGSATATLRACWIAAFTPS